MCREKYYGYWFIKGAASYLPLSTCIIRTVCRVVIVVMHVIYLVYRYATNSSWLYHLTFETVVIAPDDSHDGIIKWKHFHVTGTLCGQFTDHRRIPLTKASDADFYASFDLRRNKWFSKQSGHRWFKLFHCWTTLQGFITKLLIYCCHKL